MPPDTSSPRSGRHGGLRCLSSDEPQRALGLLDLRDGALGLAHARRALPRGLHGDAALI
jgi:hypothetical protein